MQAYLAFGAGMLFMAVLLAIAILILHRPVDRPVPRESMLIFRVVLALAAGAFAAILTGFLDVSAKSAVWTLRTGGGLAVFVMIYLVDPPERLDKNIRSPKKPKKIAVPPERLIPPRSNPD
jgi:hypothetical protein